MAAPATTSRKPFSHEAAVLDGTTPLVVPVAVRLIDLEAPLGDLSLRREESEKLYRSLMAVVRLRGDPLVVATFSVDSSGRVSSDRLVHGLQRSLQTELNDAQAQAAPEPMQPLQDVSVPRRIDRLRAVSTARPVSVVIPTCCNPGPLERCLRSILRSDYPEFEVIVVENRPGSGDTLRMLADRFPGESRLRYLEEPRKGASHARNAGLAYAESEIVAFTDDDVVVDRGWIAANVGTLFSAHDIACVTGLILPLELESDSQLLMEQFASFGKGFGRVVYRLPESRRENPLFPYTPGSIGSGASTVLRADLARELGGFDTVLGPGTPTTGAEDLEIFIRVLQAGGAVAYEPGAIVWHQHPDGMRRLRRQVYKYGVGLGAMLAKQLLGPERADFVRAVPAGIRYARDPTSRKNAGKPSDYPRHLTWLERLGMLVGPVAYVLSALLATLRRVSAAAEGNRDRPVGVRRSVLLGGRPVSVVWFAEREPSLLRHQRGASVEHEMSRSATAATRAVAAVCIAAPICVALGLPSAVRMPFVLALLCLAPGMALLSAVRGRLEPGLVVGVSLGVTAVAAMSMLWLDAWAPKPMLYVLAGACLLPLGPTLRTAGLRLPTRAEILSAIAQGRIAAERVPFARASHLGVLAVALSAWAVSLQGTDVNRIAGVGLLDALPPTYFLAFAFALGGFAVAVTRDELDVRVLGAYVLALIVMLHGTTALLYNEPRYPWVYKHLGVINYIVAHGRVDRSIDIYQNWPAFFAAGALLTKTAGLAPIAYAGFAQLFFNIVNAFAVRFALRGLTRNERVLWTATFLFVLGNWVGQDYLAPQAFGFVLSLIVLGLCLRCGPATARRLTRPERWLTSRFERVRGAVLSPRARHAELPAPPLSSRMALIVGGVCFLAVVTSHQLSPVLLILSVASIAAFARRLSLWIPAAMVAVEVWWLTLAWPFVGSHFSLIQPGSGGAGAAGRDLGAALPGAVLSFYAPVAVMVAVVALAAIGLFRRLQAGVRDLVPVCLIGAPVVGVGLQSYGGEGPYRGYLFALPWLAFLGAHAWTSRPSLAGRVRRRLPALIASSFVLATFLLFAYFGQELSNRIPTDDVRAATWYEQHAAPGSIRINLAPTAPDRLTARYPLVSLSDPSSLLEQPGFAGHKLGAADVPRLTKLIRSQGPHPVYVVLTLAQENYGRLNGLLPKGSVAGLVGALGRSPLFHLVYRRPSAWVFAYVPNGVGPRTVRSPEGAR